MKEEEEQKESVRFILIVFTHSLTFLLFFILMAKHTHTLLLISSYIKLSSSIFRNLLKK